MPKPAPLDKSTVRDQTPTDPGSSLDGQLFRTGASPSLCSPTSPVPTARMPVEAYCNEYNMNHKRRGLAVIFNHETFDYELPKRPGSSVDVIDLMNVFSLLGFEPIVHRDFTRSEISEELKKLAKTDHDECDTFCIVVLSHGDSPDLLYARDAVYRQSELWEPFISSRCLSLAGKPKLFFIQACRGRQYEENTLLLKDGRLFGTQIDSMSNDWSYVIPSRVDFLISQSTCAGFCAHRHPSLGSWFIQSLCEVLNAEHATADLLKMLTIVHRQVVIKYQSFVENRPDLSGLKETPSFTSTLMRDVYFRPKPKPVSPEESDSPADQSEELP